MSRKYPGRAPAYVRIRIELCASRGKSGNTAKTYLSRSFVAPDSFEKTYMALLGLYGMDEPTKRELAKLSREIREAVRRSKADIPKDVDLDTLMAKRKRIAEDAARRFKPKDLNVVFKRIPLRDFQTYPARVQRYLVQYLAHGRETARTELTRMGLRWRTYVPGKPRSLFRGRKRASSKR